MNEYHRQGEARINPLHVPQIKVILNSKDSMILVGGPTGWFRRSSIREIHTGIIEVGTRSDEC